MPKYKWQLLKICLVKTVGIIGYTIFLLIMYIQNGIAIYFTFYCYYQLWE